MPRPTQYQTISVRLDAESKRLRAELSKVKREIRGTRKATSQLKSQLLGIFGTAAVIAGVTQLTRKAVMLRAEFSKQISTVKALTKATDAQEKSFSDLAQELGRSTQFTAKQAAESMEFLAMAGLSVNEIMEATPKTLQLAATGSIELAEAADIATNVMSAYNLKAKDLGRVNDIIANTITNANTNVIEFAEAFKMVGPLAKGTGVSIEELSAEIGLLANSGIKATMAGTALRGMISGLLKPTDEQSKRLNALGITIRDQQGNFVGLAKVFEQLREAGADYNDLLHIFEKRQLSAAQVLLSSVPAYDSFLEKVGESGTAANVAAEKMDNLQGDLLRLQSAWDGLLLKMSEGDGILRKTVQGITDIVTAVSELDQKFSSFGSTMDTLWRHLATKNVFARMANLFIDDKAAPTSGTGPQPGPDPYSAPAIPVFGTGETSGVKDIPQSISRVTQELEKLQGLKSTLDPDDVGLIPAMVTGRPEMSQQVVEKIEAVKDALKSIRDEAISSIGAQVTSVFQQFATAFTTGENVLKQFLDYFKKWALQMIAQIAAIAAAAALLNVLLPGAGGFGGIFGTLFSNNTGLGQMLKSLKTAQLSQGLLGNIPSYDVGTPYVPKTGLAMVHRGERIVPAGQNKQMLTAVVRGEDLHFALTEYQRRM